MTSYNYIKISTSGSGPIEKKFKAIGWMPVKEKLAEIVPTVGGKLDSVWGGVFSSNQYILKVPEAVEVGQEAWGKKSDLDYFFSLNSPSGTPSNRLVLTDHYGATHNVWLVGKYAPEPLASIIEGTCAYFMIQIEAKTIP